MSDVLNHYYCSRETYKLLVDQPDLLELINKNYDAYRLGSQGPDFFYYDLLPNESPLTSKIGYLIHTEKIDDFFYYGLKFAQDNPKYTDITLAYLFGFLTHYTLDTNTHPFIYYRTGTSSDKPKEIRRSKKLHKFYEILLDTAMMQYEYSKLAVTLNPEKVFYVNPYTLHFLELFYKYILKKLFNIDLPKSVIKHSLKFSAQLISFFKDQSGFKHKISELIENMIGNKKIITEFLYPTYTNEYSILNINKNDWINPVTGETSDLSYPELYFQAAEEASHIIRQIYHYVRNGDIESINICQLIPNKSYLTGILLDQNQNKQYFDENFKSYLEKY